MRETNRTPHDHAEGSEQRDRGHAPIQRPGVLSLHRLFARERTIPAEGEIERKNPYQQKKEVGAISRNQHRREGGNSHRPKVNFTPAAMGATAFARDQRDGCDKEGGEAGGDVKPQEGANDLIHHMKLLSVKVCL